MTIVIQIYIIVCIALLVFDICFLFLKNRKKEMFFPKNEKLEEQILDEIKVFHQEGGFSLDFETSLERKLNKTQNLITLMSVLEENPKEKENFRPFVFDKIDEYAKKSDYEQAYYTYVISTFDYKNIDIAGNFAVQFIKFLDSKSLYTFVNTMEAIYAFGKDNLLLQALDKVDEREGFYNEKLLIDGLLSAKVDFETFNQALLAKFDSYSDAMKVALLDYFRYNGADIAEVCLSLLQKENVESEVRYSAMRYFTKFQNERADAYCLKLLKQEEAEWVEQMLAIQVLSQSKHPFAYATIKEKIYSPNWYVRLNAANYVSECYLDQAEMFEILSKKDKYANEILLYVYRDDREMSKYISSIIQQFEEEEQQQKEKGQKNVHMTAQAV